MHIKHVTLLYPTRIFANTLVHKRKHITARAAVHVIRNFMVLVTLYVFR